ncbi:MAG: hypothetical protein R6U61_06605 [Thermoplasmata archaeon]
MKTLICKKCMEVHVVDDDGDCPSCGSGEHSTYDFSNSEDRLEKETERVKKERKELGLDGLVGGLEAVIINTENSRHVAAVEELLSFTGLKLHNSFRNPGLDTAVLKREGSADFLVRTRKTGSNPFKAYNKGPKSDHLPNTRLETFIFKTEYLEEYYDIQAGRGVNFMTDDIIETDNYYFIQTIPSTFTGNSMGFIEWKGERGSYMDSKDESVDVEMNKPEKEYLNNVGYLDHVATRVRAKDRDSAIIEYMELTNYDFDFAIYVKVFNSITNVARLTDEKFAMVFTSGIAPYEDEASSGPTERYIHNYNTRVHHMAFKTDHIDDTFQAIKEDGMDFLIELVGSPGEGLKQTFTTQSPNTLLVNEYIHRYGDFDGFFTRSNVTKLTEATKKQ